MSRRDSRSHSGRRGPTTSGVPERGSTPGILRCQDKHENLRAPAQANVTLGAPAPDQSARHARTLAAIVGSGPSHQALPPRGQTPRGMDKEVGTVVHSGGGRQGNGECNRSAINRWSPPGVAAGHS